MHTSEFSRSIDIPGFSKITTAMYSAAVGQVPWEHFLRNLSEISGDICTHLIGFDAVSELALEMASVGYDPDFVETYHQHYAELNAWAPRFATFDAGRAVDCEDMCATPDLLKTEFYNDWLRPQEDIKEGGGVVLFKDQDRFLAIGGNIRLRDAENLKANWLNLVQYLTPHLQQAFEISRAFAGSRLETDVVAEHSLREIPGILLMNYDSRITFANQVAERMLDTGHPISCDFARRLWIGSKSEPEGFGPEFLRLRLTDSSPPLSWTVPISDSFDRFVIRFARFSPDNHAGFSFSPVFGASDQAILVVIVRESAGDRPDLRLTKRYHLTQAEAEIAIAISEGQTIKEIAELRSVSVHTVRNQLKTIMHKLDVHRQTEVAKIVLEMSE